jgi:nitrogen fixation NifU-like protein
MPDASVEGANPLCGDRVRVEIRVANGTIAEAGFTADACVLCVASASLLTSHVRGMSMSDARELSDTLAFELVGGTVPMARRRCATLPLDTLRRAVMAVERGSSGPSSK